MPRKFGKTYKMKEKFEDYSYIINGVGSIGKTTLVYEIGKIITGSNEGTFIITCGAENQPKHIGDAFGDVAPDFKTFMAIVKELCENKEGYPFTKFVAVDSLDEYARICENFVIEEWNRSCDINERAKSISQAYKGFQKGESRACDLMIQQVMKLQEAGYSLLEIGHTKTKLKSDELTQVQFEQLTCNLDNKYYNALKDKVNLVMMCYFENIIDNVKEKKNAFTKKMDKVGELTDRKRVAIFADDANAIDTKSHFEYIVSKIDLSAQGFIKAVEDAIREKLNHIGEIHVVTEDTVSTEKFSTPTPTLDDSSELESVAENIQSSETDIQSSEPESQLDDVPFDISDDDNDEEVVETETEESTPESSQTDPDELRTTIREAFKNSTPDKRKAVKSVLSAHGGKLSDAIPVDALLKIQKILED